MVRIRNGTRIVQYESVLVPARTRGSVCYFEHNACRLCFSASPRGLSPASHTASPAGKKSAGSLLFTNHPVPPVENRSTSFSTSNSLASKYWRYCWGKTSLKPSKNAWVCSSTPLDSLHSATNLQKHQDELNNNTNIWPTSAEYYQRLNAGNINMLQCYCLYNDIWV